MSAYSLAPDIAPTATITPRSVDRLRSLIHSLTSGALLSVARRDYIWLIPVAASRISIACLHLCVLYENICMNATQARAKNVCETECVCVLYICMRASPSQRDRSNSSSHVCVCRAQARSLQATRKNYTLNALLCSRRRLLKCACSITILWPAAFFSPSFALAPLCGPPSFRDHRTCV